MRWEPAKSLKLCYRCLGGDHRGLACVRSRMCGINSSKNTHNRLLHRDPFPTDRSDQELELQGEPQKVTVNVLNGQTETFETTPVEFELESMNGNVATKMSAFTAERVTGSMKVIKWEKHVGK